MIVFRRSLMPPVPKIYLKLKEAEYQAVSVKKRYTHDEVMTELRKAISGKENKRKA
jgi:hypothetical protein